MQKISGQSLNTNNHLNNQSLINKDLMDIPNQKTLVNHVQVHTQIPLETKETLKSIKLIEDNSKAKETPIINKELIEDKEIGINNCISSNTELLSNSYNKPEKEQTKSSDKNIKKVTLKTRKRNDISNNASLFPVK